jgi:hypothetical protein
MTVCVRGVPRRPGAEDAFLQLAKAERRADAPPPIIASDPKAKDRVFPAHMGQSTASTCWPVPQPLWQTAICATPRTAQRTVTASSSTSRQITSRRCHDVWGAAGPGRPGHIAAWALRSALFPPPLCVLRHRYSYVGCVTWTASIHRSRLLTARRERAAEARGVGSSSRWHAHASEGCGPCVHSLDAVVRRSGEAHAPRARVPRSRR